MIDSGNFFKDFVKESRISPPKSELTRRKYISDCRYCKTTEKTPAIFDGPENKTYKRAVIPGENKIDMELILQRCEQIKRMICGTCKGESQGGYVCSTCQKKFNRWKKTK